MLLFAAIRPIVGWSSYWTVLLESIVGACLIAVLAFKTHRPQPIRLFRFFGRISYSFYLLHPLVLPFLMEHMSLYSEIALYYHPVLIAFVVFFLSVAVITPVAWVQHQWVELPGIRLGKRLTRVDGASAGPDKDWRTPAAPSSI